MTTDASMAATTSARAVWIDIAKCVAIFAVMFDHANGTAFPFTNLVIASHFSVGLFVFVMGVTSFWSFRRHGGTSGIAKRCWKVFRPYLVATFIYCLFRYRAFDFEVFLNHVVRFNASGPLYYVLLYMQLLVAAPFLFRTCSHTGLGAFWSEAATFAGVLVFSALTTNHTNILDVYGGGGKLFGGTYLSLLYLGMLFGKYCPRIPTGRRRLLFLSLLSTGMALAWLVALVPRRGVVDCLFPFGKGLNPPGVCLMIYALLIAFSCFCIGTLVQTTDSHFLRKAFRPVVWIGRHTLFLFLYHRLFLDFLFAGLFSASLSRRFPSVVSGLFCFISMTIGSILLETFIERPFHSMNPSGKEQNMTSPPARTST